MDTVYVKPSQGGRIRQPERNGRVMPETGDLVPRDSYYERLLIGGDIVETDPPAEPSGEHDDDDDPEAREFVPPLPPPPRDDTRGD
jgi:hypothetical protein